MTDTAYPERWLDVYDKHNGRFRCRTENESELDAKYSAYLDSGKTKDGMIELTLLSGSTIKIAVSEIANWIIITLAEAEEAVRATRAFINVMKAIDPDFQDATDD